MTFIRPAFPPPGAVLLLLVLFGSLVVPCWIPDADAGPREKKIIKKLNKQIKSLKRELALATRPEPQPGPPIAMVSVGHLKNSPDQDFGDGSFGTVNYGYRIGKYEVNLEQYAVFLNAVAASDPHDLYHPDMAGDLNIAGIQRNGADGSYTYTVVGNGERPVTYVSWFDAARFCNWLHNGSPTGAQDATTTERGAYLLDGTVAGDVTIIRSPGARFWIPGEDEWYKAAYHQPAGAGGDADDYWLFPTRSNTAPGNDIGGAANQANFVTGDGHFSVTEASLNDPNQNYLTPGGSYSGSASFHGTHDQGGNVYEWNEGVIADAYRSARGGWWLGLESTLRSSSRLEILTPESEGALLGFRIASP